MAKVKIELEDAGTSDGEHSVAIKISADPPLAADAEPSAAQYAAMAALSAVREALGVTDFEHTDAED